MAEYDESEYFTDSKEEIAEREAQEAMRRLVRTEIRRVQSGAADEDIANDIALEEQEAELATKKHSRVVTVIKNFISGDILLADQAKRVYNLVTFLGAVFFISIMVLFGALQREIKCRALQKEVALLKERAIRASEIRFQSTSHSAILRQLAERNININDPKDNPTILK